MTPRVRRAAPTAEVPAEETAATEAPETPGAAEPDTAAPGSGQDGPAHEPALDEAQGPDGDGGQDDGSDDPAPAERYDFAAHARRVLFTPWPAYADAPVIFAPDMRAEWNDIAASAARGLDAAHAEAAAAEAAGSRRAHDRLDAYLLMRTERFPAHARQPATA